MATARVEATGREAHFTLAELFFSTTDRRGRITSGNSVFARTSGYPLGELIGRPHNVIRHPGVPRAVYGLLWQTIASGAPMAAYVVNLAANGDHYWVMASIAAIPDGYLSVRLKPSTPHLAMAQQWYAETLATEEAAAAAGASRSEVVAAGADRLLALLADAGYPSYDDFMFAALPAEVSARAAVLGQGVADLVGPSVGRGGGLGTVLEMCHTLDRDLGALVGRIDEYVDAGRAMSTNAAYVSRLARSIDLFAMNTKIVALSLGDRGAALHAVAGLIKERSADIGPAATAVGALTERSQRTMHELAFRIAVSKLHVEMTANFVREFIDDDTGAADGRTLGDLVTLADRIDTEITALTAAIEQAAGVTEALAPEAAAIMQVLGEMAVLEFNGRVEVARLPERTDVEDLFLGIRARLDEATRQLVGFGALDGLTADAARVASLRSLAASVAASTNELHAMA